MKPRRARRPFVALRSAEISAAAPADAGLFLGRLDADGLRRELAEAGILEGLAERGYPDVVILTSVAFGEHRLRVRRRRGRVSLVDLRLAESTAVAAAPGMRARGLDVLSFLSVHWVALQHPKGRFTPERPRLPGQTYPGLGLGKRLFDRLISWAAAWGKDGLLNFPQYFHNAVLYSSLFRFLDPARQGGFEALCRDLSSLHVAGASAAVESGHVVEAPAGSVFEWTPGEMVAPLTPGLRRYLDSDAYGAAVRQARESVRYLFSPPQSSQGHRPRRSRKL